MTDPNSFQRTVRRALVWLSGSGYVMTDGVRAELDRPMYVPGVEPYDEIEFRPRPLLPTAYVKRRGKQSRLSDAEQHAIDTKLRRIASATRWEIERRRPANRREIGLLPWTGPERRHGERRASSTDKEPKP